MSYEATIYCDLCSTIIAAANTAEIARAENRHAGGASRAPHDICQSCVAGGATIARLTAPTPEAGAS